MIAQPDSLGFTTNASPATTTTANQTPVAADDAFAATQDTPLSIAAPGVLTNDADPENSSLSAILEILQQFGSPRLREDIATFGHDIEALGGTTYPVFLHSLKT